MTKILNNKMNQNIWDLFEKIPEKDHIHQITLVSGQCREAGYNRYLQNFGVDYVDAGDGDVIVRLSSCVYEDIGPHNPTRSNLIHTTVYESEEEFSEAIREFIVG